MKRILILLVIALPLWGKGGAFKSTKHADPIRGPQRKADFPPGSCVQCHDGHPSHQRTAQRSRGCAECHVLPVDSTAHTSACTDCHDPHGVKDDKGVIPGLLRGRQETLCIGCHDGTRAADIRQDLLQPYVHRVACTECHNAHRDALWGVTRVEVINGSAGTQPNYTFKTADEPAPANEYEICFKCHSSFIKQRLGVSDLARLTNPENPSFHPIQSEGRNRRIDPDAFVTGWDADSRVTCSDCHDPHGSMHAALLQKRAPLSSDNQTMTRTDLCFDCHSFRVYGDPVSEGHGATRFGAHAMHVGTQRVPCHACHETHGSTRHPYLIANRRNPGITNFTSTSSGGTCTSTCHGMKTYSLNYAR